MAELPDRRLEVWREAFRLAMEIVEFTEVGEVSKRWHVRDQIAAAALSVPANIAEGNGRSTPKDYASFIDRARGSLFEVDNWLLVCRERQLLESHQYLDWAQRVEDLSSRLLRLARALREKDSLASRG